MIDWPVLIFIGLLFGYGVRGSPGGSLLRTRAHLSGMAVVTLFIFIAYDAYRLEPDWMFMYFAPASEIPRWIVFYILILYYAAYGVGFFLKFELEKVWRYLPKFLLIFFLAASVFVILPLKGRYQSVGTFDEFHSGRFIPLAQSRLGKRMAASSLILLPVGVGLLLWSRREKDL